MAPRVNKDPNHPDFPHGENKGYVRGCKCQRCLRAHAARMNRNILARQRGVKRKVPAAQVIAHIDNLCAQHRAVNVAVVARAAGVKVSTLRTMTTRRDRGGAVLCETGQKVLAVTLPQCLEQVNFVPSGPVVEMHQHLRAHGYGLPEQARLMGVGDSRTRSILSSVSPFVTREYAEKVRALHERLTPIPGPSNRVRMDARKAGYFPPACYDEDGNYVPGSSPDEINRKTDSGREDHAGRVLDTLREILVNGSRVPDAAAKFGISDKSFQRWATGTGLRLEYVVDRTVPTAASRWVVDIMRDGLDQWSDGAPSTEITEWIVTEAARFAAARDTLGVAA